MARTVGGHTVRGKFTIAKVSKSRWADTVGGSEWASGRAGSERGTRRIGIIWEAAGDVERLERNAGGRTSRNCNE